VTATRPADVPRPDRCSHLPADDRGYPIIATINQDPGEVNFGALSERRKLALATFDLCAVCALPFHTELRWIVSFETCRNDSAVVNEAPVHEICALYAAQICPFVSSPYARFGDDVRKGQRRPDRVILSGFRTTKRVFGHSTPLQPGAVLHFEMSGLVRTHRLTNRNDANHAYAAALANEVPIAVDPQEQQLVDLLCAPTLEENEDSGGVMAGAAVYVGAAFCPDIKAVRSLSRYFIDGHYEQVAAQTIVDKGFAPKFAESDDPATRAAMNWLLTRVDLPRVLDSWRRAGRRRIIVRRPGSASPDDHRRAKRKNQAAARRRNRRS
jgi:hypothetical protein